MNPRVRRLLALLFAWYVVTYSGQKFMGPFTFLGDCSDEAQRLNKQYYNVSALCKHFSD